MTPTEAHGALAELLGEFHGELVRVSSVLPGPAGTLMVARITPSAMARAVTALAELRPPTPEAERVYAGGCPSCGEDTFTRELDPRPYRYCPNCDWTDDPDGP